MGYLEVASSNEILCVTPAATKVIFKKKSKKRKRNTTESEIIDPNDPEKWVIGPANAAGWFRILNPFSKKYLTSSKKALKIEEKTNIEKSKDKELVIQKKVFVWCPFIEEFITYVAFERNYEDQDLQVDLGLDGGGDFFKIVMSIQPVKQINNDSPVRIPHCYLF